MSASPSGNRESTAKSLLYRLAEITETTPTTPQSLPAATPLCHTVNNIKSNTLIEQVNITQNMYELNTLTVNEYCLAFKLLIKVRALLWKVC